MESLCQLVSAQPLNIQRDQEFAVCRVKPSKNAFNVDSGRSRDEIGAVCCVDGEDSRSPLASAKPIRREMLKHPRKPAPQSLGLHVGFPIDEERILEEFFGDFLRHPSRGEHSQQLGLDLEQPSDPGVIIRPPSRG